MSRHNTPPSDAVDDASNGAGEALDSTASEGEPADLDATLRQGHLGRYLVRGAVGSGGMGVVVAAYDPELDRKVAIKLVATERTEPRARLVREAQAMARLSHPNVVTVYEVIWIGERAGIVMELVEGHDLAAWRKARPRGWREIVAVYVQAARGLSAAHRAGLVHRDFKPSNVLIGADGVVRVTDFGLARAVALGELEPAQATPSTAAPNPLDVTLTRTGAMIGTPAYMAPEQHLGAVVDARTDQWAFGCALYEALHGQRPFDGDEREHLRDNVVGGALRPEPPASEVPRAIRAAVRRALSRRPDDRFADMDALIAALTVPARRAWRLAAGALAMSTVAITVALVATMRQNRLAATCEGLEAPMAARWNPSKAQALRARMIGAGRSAAAADGVLSTLDQYGRLWTSMRQQACSMTRQGVQSQERLDRRMRCLDQRLTELGGVVEGLLEPGARRISAAGDAVDRLRPLSDCDDPHESVPRPPGARARLEIDRAETELARAHSFKELNQYERALPLAKDAAAVGQRTGWAPLEARALLLVGQCQQLQRDFTTSLATLDRAASVAASAKDDAVVADALAERFLLLDEYLGRPADALSGRSYIELALVRAGQPPALRARWLHYLAIALYEENRYDDALPFEVEAVRMWRTLVRPDSGHLLDSLETEANIEVGRKQFDAAQALLEEVMRGRIAARGPNDPLVASVEVNLGVLEFTRNELAAAIEHWERAARIDASSGTLNWRVHSNLGEARVDFGRLRAAASDFATALEMATREAPGESVSVGECATALGSVWMALGQLDRAGPLIARGLAAARNAKSESLTTALFVAARYALARGEIATAASELSELTAASRNPEDLPRRLLLEAEVVRARAGCRAARDAVERAFASLANDPYHSDRLEAAVLAARCHVELGEPARAIREIEPEVKWLDDHHADAEAAAPAKLALARALAASGGDRVRAQGGSH